MWRGMHLARPFALTAVGYWLSAGDYKMANVSAPLVITDNRSSGGMIKEMRLKDNELSVLQLSFMVLKRYYRGLMRVSFKVWFKFIYDHSVYLLSLIFLLLV
jgi:hypothetical protein